MAEAFGIVCHELVSHHFRCGSTTDSRDLPPPRPELGDKRTSISGDWTSDSSHNRTFDNLLSSMDSAAHGR